MLATYFVPNRNTLDDIKDIHNAQKINLFLSSSDSSATTTMNLNFSTKRISKSTSKIHWHILAVDSGSTLRPTSIACFLTTITINDNVSAGVKKIVWILPPFLMEACLPVEVSALSRFLRAQEIADDWEIQITDIASCISTLISFGHLSLIIIILDYQLFTMRRHRFTYFSMLNHTYFVKHH